MGTHSAVVHEVGTLTVKVVFDAGTDVGRAATSTQSAEKIM